MQLVYKEYYPALALFYLLKDGFETLLKFAPVFCSGYERAHIEREYRAVFKAVRNVPAHYTQRKSLRDGGLSDTRLADEYGVVLALSRKYPDNVPDLAVSADHRVELVRSCQLHEILSVFFQHVIGALGIVAGHSGISAHGLERFKEFVLCYAEAVYYLAGLVLALLDKSQKQMLYGYIFVAHLLCRFLRAGESRVSLLRNIDLPGLSSASRNSRQTVNAHFCLLVQSRSVYAHFFKKLRYKILRLLRHDGKDMELIYALIGI